MDTDDFNQREGDRPRIKVTDRRKFTADGTPRTTPDETTEDRTESDAASSAASPAAGAAPTERTPDRAPEEGSPARDESAAPSSATSSSAPSAAPTDAGGRHAEETRADSATDSGIAQLPRDFGAFVEGMYLEAMLYMGAIADPRTGETVDEPEMAKYKIDLLAMLQEKTAGNLSEQEQQQLEEVLYQLRMLYLQKTNAVKL